jgi:predicted phage terminase large subunit-like protein
MKVTKEVVKGLVGSLLSESFDDAVESPAFHEEAWELCCSNANRVAIGAPRGHAKTSGITLGYGLSTLLFRERKFMILVSDTEAQACMFLGLFRQQLANNDELADLFDLGRDDKGRIDFVKESETDIIVRFKDGKLFRIIAKGAEQKLRGMIWDGIRPDIILCDDMENDELVMNKERREKMRNWFYSALLPCLSKNGVIRVVGTILHMDSLLERFMPENQTIVNKRDHLKVEDLKVTTTYKHTAWKSIRYKAHDAEYKKLLWPQRYEPQFCIEKYQDYMIQGIPDKYSQEYLNTPLDESTAYFKKSDFHPRSEEDKKKKLNYYITVDLAIAEHEKADWSVFVVAGMDENRLLHVVHVVRERLDGREIVNQLITLQKMFDPIAIGIEDTQVSKSMGPFLYEEMIKRGVFSHLVQLKHGGKDKIARSRAIQARMRAGGVRFNMNDDWFDTFQSEHLQFPRGKHDDQVDAFAYLGLMLLQLTEAPTVEEIEEEEYEDERRNSGYTTAGRSAVTGY